MRALRQLPAACEGIPRSRRDRSGAARRDRASLLHRSVSHRVRCPGRRASATSPAAPASCSIAPRSTRRPAVSRSTPERSAAPAWSTSSMETTARSCTSSRGSELGSRGWRSGQGSTRRRIDWARRFDHMQQHTGQHVLSAAIDRVLRRAHRELPSWRRHGDDRPGARADPGGDRGVGRRRQRAWSGTIGRSPSGSPTPTEAAALNLRKESVRTGTLRIIDVDGFDVSACGGTHVRRTGAIGVIAISGWERFRGGTRLEFKCGGRALARPPHAARHGARQQRAAVDRRRRAAAGDRAAPGGEQGAAPQAEGRRRQARGLRGGGARGEGGGRCRLSPDRRGAGRRCRHPQDDGADDRRRALATSPSW